MRKGKFKRNYRGFWRLRKERGIPSSALATVNIHLNSVPYPGLMWPWFRGLQREAFLHRSGQSLVNWACCPAPIKEPGCLLDFFLILRVSPTPGFQVSKIPSYLYRPKLSRSSSSQYSKILQTLVHCPWAGCCICCVVFVAQNDCSLTFCIPFSFSLPIPPHTHTAG